MKTPNYDMVKSRLEIESWSYETEKLELREPSPMELLQLLEAMRADLTGHDLPELADYQRRW